LTTSFSCRALARILRTSLRSLRISSMYRSDRSTIWRGVSREALRIQDWLKDAAPSNELRKWYGHDASRWDEFSRRYRAELQERPEALAPLLDAARVGDVTLVYAKKDTERNNAVVLAEVLRERLG